MKKFWKRWLCVALAVLMLAVFPIPTLGEENVMEWTYDNSIVVTINTDTPQQFKPEDFPEIDCERVLAVSKSTTNEGIIYKLVLVLRDSGEYNVEKAIEIATKDPSVTNASKNEKYNQLDNRVDLNHSQYTLKIGEKVDLKIVNVNVENSTYFKTGVFFTIDPNVIDNSTIAKDSFEKYGIYHFWPCRHPESGLSYPDTNDASLEGCRSETGEYYALISSDTPALEIADHLAQESGISMVCVAFNHDLVVGGPPQEHITWDTQQQEYIALDYEGETAIIRGRKPGIATVMVTWEYNGVILTNSCRIEVLDDYCEGDINKDGWINSTDALLILQDSVGIRSLNQEEKKLADLDNNRNISTADALIILQISVGLLP